MTLVHYQPWGLINQVQRDLSRFFEPTEATECGDGSDIAADRWSPAVDIKEEDQRFVLYCDIPGVDPKDIDITMDQGFLTIRGDRSLENDEQRQGYRRTERVRGTFYRRFSLPESANAEGIVASGKHGVLEVTIPKQAEEQPRKITVQA